MTRKERAIATYEAKIMKANQRLGNLRKKFGDSSPLYQAYKVEIEQMFTSMGMDDLITKGPTGAIKIDKKKAAYHIAHMRRNEKNLFSGTIGSVPTLAKLKKEAAAKMGISQSKVGILEMEASHQMEQDLKRSIQALYRLIEGDSYRKILIPELYEGNNGKLKNIDEIKDMIDFYKNHSQYIKTASVDDLKALRRKAEHLDEEEEDDS